MTAALKLIPLLLAWSGMAAFLARRFPGQSKGVALSCAAGFCSGVAGAALLLSILKGDLPYSVIKTVTGGGFLLLLGVSAGALYHATGRGKRPTSTAPKGLSLFVTYGSTLLAALLAGAVCACSLATQSGGPSLLSLVILGTAGAFLAFAACGMERFIPAVVTVTSETLLFLVISLFMLMSSFIIRLDLFSPLTMKVMKFIHDFVHQFFESMLVPDHLFFRPDTWEYIGYLFGSSVGFWSGLIVWFSPALFIILAINLEPLPTVAHIRQGAKRRKLLASFIRERRCRLIVPCFSVLLLAGAVYRSTFPSVEYWDPKPVVVAVSPSGQIVIPKKGEMDLEDGKLHKFSVREKGREARFFVMMTPPGKLAVTLDACAICKPEGYGQAEGSVICYYCKTLIPLETVGKPGGCNPVPVPFEEKGEAVSIDALTLLNIWGNTVSATTRARKGGR